MVYSEVCSADFNQTSEQLPSVARGKQCVPCSLMFLIIANCRCCTSITTNDLNNILFAGTFMYCKLLIQGLRHDLVHPEELPKYVKYKSVKFLVQHKQVLTGLLSGVHNQIFYSLETALNEGFSVGRNGIIIFDTVSVGIYYDSCSFYIFDSHSRDKNGMVAPEGKCILGTVKNIKELCMFFRSLVMSLLGSLSGVQFDLHLMDIRQQIKFRNMGSSQIFEVKDHFAEYNGVCKDMNILCSPVATKRSSVRAENCLAEEPKTKKSRASTLISKLKENRFSEDLKAYIDDRHMASHHMYNFVDNNVAHTYSVRGNPPSFAGVGNGRVSCGILPFHDPLKTQSGSSIEEHADFKVSLEQYHASDRLVAIHSNIAYSKVCSADFNQGADHFPSVARGKQCVPCSLMFLITAYSRSCTTFTTNDLNNILCAGTSMYCKLLVQGLEHDLVHPQELPKYVKYTSVKFLVQHKQVLSGLLSGAHSQNFYSLETALNEGFTVSRNCIIIFNAVSVGIHYDTCCFYIFDSHSRDNNGLLSPEGRCILGSVSNVKELCGFLRSLSLSLCSGMHGIQFDLHIMDIRSQKKFKHKGYHSNLVFEVDHDHYLYSPSISSCKNQADAMVSLEKSQNIKKVCAVNVANLCNGKNLGSFVDDRHLSTKPFSRMDVQDYCSEQQSESVLYTEVSVSEPLLSGRSVVCETFHKLICKGPNYVCSCCTQTFFRHSVFDSSRVSCITGSTLKIYLSGKKSVDDKEWICNSCKRALSKGLTPSFWVHNGLSFPVKPKELELFNLEERLVCPRLPFMQLREMPRGGQINLKGNIINVPADVNNTIKSLPRLVNESETIMLKLKRKLAYKHHVAFENIRPLKVFKAAQWLVANSEIFRNEGIVVNENWLDSPMTIQDASDISDNAESTQCSDSDSWTEEGNFEQRPTGNFDTFLQPIDFREFNQILSVAPAENNTPIGIFQDIHSESLSFPTIYCGQPRTDNNNRLVPLHYSAICKWELRNVDRRVVQCLPNIFYKLKRLQIKQIRDKVTLALRKCKVKGKTFSAGDILSPGFVEKLTMQDDGFRVLRTIRGSPPYWEHAKRDVLAMVRQLGIPTWFCSFSAAETKWVPLLRSLYLLKHGKDVTSVELESLSWNDKCDLIKSDPVTCARYFDFRVQSFIKHVLKHKQRPIGEILDYFYRVEFQQRGSPHIHMVIWIENSPMYGTSSEHDIVAFVDKYVTCYKDGSMPVLVNYQTHRHAKTCRKNGKPVCRFSFPLPPMPFTVVLEPLDKDTDAKMHQLNYEKIMQLLDVIHKEKDDMSFENFLLRLGLTYADYIMSIRSSLQTAKVFLKRRISEVRINSYNDVLLKSWEANMDLQFILNPYACVSYIVSYISKGQRGLSNLLQEACHEAREETSDIRQQVRRIGNQFLSHVEVGAQESVYLVLQLPLRRCTRDVVYVDTSTADKRTVLLKSFSDLQEMPESSKSIETDNTLKRYCRRPQCLESICYADFASWYNLIPKEKRQSKLDSSNTQPELPETEFEYDEEDDLSEEGPVVCGNKIKYPDGTCISKRTRQKVIYHHSVPINVDREEHYREQIMLYTSWRDEDRDLMGLYQTYEEHYNAVSAIIMAKKSEYEKTDNTSVEEICLEGTDDLESYAFVNQEGQHQEMIDKEEGFSVSQEHECFNPGQSPEGESETYDLGQDFGIDRRCSTSSLLPSKEVSNEQFLEMSSLLNEKQQLFFNHILHWVKTKKEPLYTFLSGGAGVGKSLLLKVLYQAILKFYNHKSDETPDHVKILLCAPTGKAAHNIGGSTIHSAFGVPANQGYSFKPLDMQQLNSMRSRYNSLKMVFIDEISMVGRSLFNFINLRLQEIMGTQKPFGGVSILAFGDLFQLQPVLDSWIFSQVYRNPTLNTLGSQIWHDYFMFFELTEVMRQKDDLSFAQLLNRLREGNHTYDDINVLKSRLVSSQTFTDSLELFPHLFCTRDKVFTHNESILSSVSLLQRVEVEAVDTVSGNLSSSLQCSILKRVPNDPSLTMGLHKKLQLGIGLPAEMCVNIDTDDGLTNGASCVVENFDYRVENSSRCSIIWVTFDDITIGRKWRVKYRHLYEDNTPKNWVPILETCRKFTVKVYKTYLIARRQFPLHLAAAKTIHKSQGTTMKQSVLHFGHRKINHIHYVGLSRLTNLSGLYISELNEKKIGVCDQVVNEMLRLRNEKNLQLCVPDLKYTGVGKLIICFQNCRSLRKHYPSISKQANFKCADILAFTETRVSFPLDRSFEMDGFESYCSRAEDVPHGMVVYYKKMGLQFRAFTASGIECVVTHLENGVHIGFIYCPPVFAKASVMTAFLLKFFEIIPETRKTIIMGDFNQHFPCAISKVLETRFGFTQLIHSITTDYDSCLDHIYINFPLTESEVVYGTLESHYSDHKPLYIAVEI